MKIHGKHICFLFVLGILPATIIIIGTQTLFNLNILYAQNNNILKASNKSLEKFWESPNQLKNPESVVHDSRKNMLYVSNVDGNPDDKAQLISPIFPAIEVLSCLTFAYYLHGMRSSNLQNYI